MINDQIILPGSTLGMLGGGQLGGFFAEAALRMGYKVAVWDPDPSAPAKRFAYKKFDGDFQDVHIQKEFSKVSDAISLEWENVPATLVSNLEKQNIVRPGSNSLSLAQHRASEKNFLTSNGFPVTNYEVIENKEEFTNIEIELPWIVKTATLGYDGHGQWKVTSSADKKNISNNVTGSGPWIVEKVVNYDLELSVIVASDGKGKLIPYPPTENIHENNILRLSLNPGRFSNLVAERAKDLACQVIKSIGDPGLFCVELFLDTGENLLVNEIAPRPHNSGHHTMDVFSVSQYEQQVRALCGLPLINPNRLNNSVLLNILGEEHNALQNSKSINAILEDSAVRIYSYGKSNVRKNRKMGHVMFLSQPIEELLRIAEKVHDFMKN